MDSDKESFLTIFSVTSQMDCHLFLNLIVEGIKSESEIGILGVPLYEK